MEPMTIEARFARLGEPVKPYYPGFPSSSFIREMNEYRQEKRRAKAALRFDIQDFCTWMYYNTTWNGEYNAR